MFWKSDPRRRQFFIKKEFQGIFILLYSICVIGPAGLAVGGLYVKAQLKLEKLLFSSHLKITNTGEIFRDLLLTTNIISSALIVVLVTLLSLYIFRRLNKHFYRMEERFEAMGRGDFSLQPQQPSRFNEISTLIDLAEQTRQDYRERFREVDLLLENLDKNLTADTTAAELRKFSEKLAMQLSRVNLPEGLSQSDG